MSRMRRNRLAVAVFATMATVSWSSVAPAAPTERDKRAVKHIKRALVSIEHRLDRTAARLESLEARSGELMSAIETAERRLVTPGGGFATGFDIVGGLLILDGARRELTVVGAQIAEAEQNIRVFDDARAKRIRELQAIVVATQERERGFSNWTLGGTLITYSADWEEVSRCESSGRWHIDSQFDGGLQFHPRTWLAFGGGEFGRHAFEATKKQQIAIAERVLAIQGSDAWPNCYHPLPFHF